ncbi:hypothetical protein [Candidatus Nitrotoga sp. 1052]|uniref:hypothetical protein n=1 Tax=Candidatus Nitrotoga sp. 1052 TaxID=2886964 RepID=UPI001EF51E93|nr:hypothetical protein [Candidatus Nitrotoga sp. 1052]CAH1081811.1 hypothetical protein NTG1052_410010 [Candidatus Nitrotoga sp. 1052]
MPEFGNSRHGDLYLRIMVQVPERLSREERELNERLNAIGGKVHKRNYGGYKLSDFCYIKSPQ